MDSKQKLLIWRIGLVAAAILLIYHVVSLNMADHHAINAGADDAEAVASALRWDATQPDALSLLGRQLLTAGQEDEAAQSLLRAIQANPASGRYLVYLAAILQAQGETGMADQMVELADRLMPVQPRVQRRIAYYWLDRERLDLAVAHISKALSGDRQYRDEFFPILLRIAEVEEARPVLAPLAYAPPTWWGGFFRYVIVNADEATTVSGLVALREASHEAPLSELERSLYINRLRKEGRVAEAYLVWVNGLDTATLQSLGYLHNGSFEREFSNAGFGWYARPPQNSGIRITTSTTYGIGGRQALRVSFQGKRLRFIHVWQHLFLSPGDYTVRGQVRPDQLKARRGLQWRVLCTAGTAQRSLLGHSDEFSGTSDWRSFEFAVSVPEGCDGQVLRLHSVGKRDVDHELDGAIWFDDMQIELKR